MGHNGDVVHFYMESDYDINHVNTFENYEDLIGLKGKQYLHKRNNIYMKGSNLLQMV